MVEMGTSVVMCVVEGIPVYEELDQIAGDVAAHNVKLPCEVREVAGNVLNW